jgi:hypothetical protein
LPWWRELTIGLAVFAVYAVVTSLDWPGRHSAAVANSRWIFGLERALHIDVELALNRWLAQNETLRVVANYEYATTYIISAFGLLIWLYLRRPLTYRWARNSFILVNLVGVTCFAVFPVAPPRFVTGPGFVDTVLLGQTWGSWGSPMVAHADQLAAMPSLHFAWALWVSLVLAAMAGSRLGQSVSGVHVAVTLLVILATANHYLLDAAGGAVLAVACVAMARPRTDVRRLAAERVAAADAFFLHVESPAAPQHVGGLVMLDLSGGWDGSAAGEGLREAVEVVVWAHLHELPRFRQRLSSPSRWRRPRWVEEPDLDWSWHVPERRLCAAGDGETALRALVAEIAGAPLPRDRPLWRAVVVPDVGPGLGAVVLVMHHVVADGIGTIAHALTLLEPPLPDYLLGQGRRREPVRAAVGTALGLAQLATDGRPGQAFPISEMAARGFGTVTLPFDDVRAAARRHGARVSDVLLAAVAGGLRRVVADPDHGPARLRIAVTIAVPDSSRRREAGAQLTGGNATAAVMMDVPLGPMSELDRLVAVVGRSRRLRTGTRALASRFVMRRVGALMPPPAHAWFARTVYGGRFFHAVVSNMPGPAIVLSLAGAPLPAAYPILPLAPRTALAVGALTWRDRLCIGIAADPALVADADRLGEAIEAVIEELGAVQPGSLAAAGEGTVADGSRPSG